MNEENLRMQQELTQHSKPAKGAGSKVGASSNVGATPSGGKGGKLNSKAGSEELTNANPPRGQKRGREMEIEKEEDYLKRHDVKIHVPDALKALLVDDWENVTKNQMLVPLPRDPTVTEILKIYKEQSPKKRAGSAEAEIFDEIIAGLKLYFDKSLGTILLYRFERQQYLEIKKEHPNKEPSDIYGAEHLLRLCGMSQTMNRKTQLADQRKQSQCPSSSRTPIWIPRLCPSFATT
jgi:mortality factor 4-like protein 1